MELYSIEVTADIATKIRILAESGVFAAKGSSCELHFDPEGNISQVVTHTYKRIEKTGDKIVASIPNKRIITPVL